MDVLTIILGSGAAAILGAFLTARSGSQRAFETRKDAELVRVIKERDEAQAEAGTLREKVERLYEERMHMRLFIISQGHDPDEVLKDRL